MAAFLVHELMEARDEKRLRALQKQLTNVKVLIVDELGYVPFTAIGAELLFEIFSRRYEHGATPERLTGAFLEWLIHQVYLLEMNGESYRLATSKKWQQRHAKTNIPSEKGWANL